MQELVTDAPYAKQFFSDGNTVYGKLAYFGGAYLSMLDKSQTYSVEGDNAELRHYLARLARSNRCFSRCIYALGRAIDLLVYYWNQRQDFKSRYPKLPAHLIDFIKTPQKQNTL
jgi:hypothetical protein